MISIIDFLDIDISSLLDEYIKTKKKNNVVLKELKDNINFTTHINYYDKYFSSTGNWLKHMIENKIETLEQINKIKGMTGWILNYPTKFGWSLDNYDKLRHFDAENHRNNLILVDSSTGWEYRSYPPQSRHYNSKDLLKYIKN